ncbi:DMT family transporter [Mesorhizobium sp. WSM4935]|uniref:DMT family transporter n=1 Tax=Mesorhizobium sp. WSM4935 TaxID=3038547 RepID=UPI00241505E6|nr:DMT family transporter [Mesorhizobium sp. WSM4935]MDG4877251.1 DMT family transporter [Mesorhizobium sp. WSM4935]
MTDAAHDITIAGLACIAAGATSWTFGNILVRRSGKVDMLALVTWLCLVPPLPLLFLSVLYEGQDAILPALRHPAWQGIGAVFFLGFVATTACFAGWGQLIKQYGAAATAPFALLVPVFGALSAWIFLGETFNLTRLTGMALIVIGVAAVILSPRHSIASANQSTRPLDHLPSHDGGDSSEHTLTEWAELSSSAQKETRLLTGRGTAMVVGGGPRSRLRSCRAKDRCPTGGTDPNAARSCRWSTSRECRTTTTRARFGLLADALASLDRSAGEFVGAERPATQGSGGVEQTQRLHAAEIGGSAQRNPDRGRQVCA